MQRESAPATLCLALLLVASLAAAASAHAVHAPVIVRLDRLYYNGGDASSPGYLEEIFGPPGTGNAIIGSIIVGAFAEADESRLSRNYAALTETMSAVDLRGALENAFTCVGLERRDISCREVRVIDADSKVIAPLEKGQAMLSLIAVTMNFSMYGNFFRADAHVEFATNDRRAARNQEVVIHYEEFGPEEIPDSPWFDDPSKVSDAEAQRRAAAREYWLTGTPSRLETTVRAAIIDVAAITSQLLAAAGGDGQIPVIDDWIDGLPPASELAAQGVRECSERRCKVRYARTTPQRDWIVDTTFRMKWPVLRSARPEVARERVSRSWFRDR